MKRVRIGLFHRKLLHISDVIKAGKSLSHMDRDFLYVFHRKSTEKLTHS